jgi:hypothetical protein
MLIAVFSDPPLIPRVVASNPLVQGPHVKPEVNKTCCATTDQLGSVWQRRCSAADWKETR